MTLDKRSTFILQELVNAQDYIFVQDLMNKLNVSRRTIYYDIEKINSWLEQQNVEPVSRSYSKGFYLSEASKKQVFDNMESIKNNQYFYTKDERIALLGVLIILKKDRLQLDDLMVSTGVSRVTTFKDLNILKQELTQFKLFIENNRNQGYVIKGSESNQRKAVAHYLTHLLAHKGWDQLSQQIHSILNPDIFSLPNISEATEQANTPNDMTSLAKTKLTKKSGDFFNKKEQDSVSHDSDQGLFNTIVGLSDFYSLLLECEDQLDIELTDEMFRSLALTLLIISMRIEQGLPVKVDEHEKLALSKTHEYSVAQSLAAELQKSFGIPFPEDEVCFLTIFLLSAKVNSVKFENNQNKEMADLKQVIKNMIFDFQKYSCIYFNDNNDLAKLMFIHLKPAYYRIKYDVFTENPLTDDIKNHYKEVYQITKKVVYHLENLVGKALNHQETAYIAMYFGGWVRRQGSRPTERRRAYVICETGLGTSNLLKFQLEQLLTTVDIVDTISLRDYQKYEYDTDMFFSTVSIPERDKPVILVNTILNNTDKQLILAKLSAFEGGDLKVEPTLLSLLDVIHKHSDVINESMLIHDLKSLLQKEKIAPKEIRKPMLSELLTENMIQFKTSVNNWEEAISVASQPLLEQNCISRNYIEAMIENVRKLGPYIVIVPNIAIPHARPEQGVKQLGMSLLCLKESVQFSAKEEHQVQLVIVLAAVDNEAHLKALSQLTTLLSDNEKVKKILAASSPQEVLPLLENNN